jgi:hypothetical protein
MKTPHRVTLGFLLSGLVACSIEPRTTDCFANSLGQGIGLAIGSGLGSAFGSIGSRDVTSQPDWARVQDAGTFISVSHERGRLQLRFEPGVAAGLLPRRDETCTMRDYATFHSNDGGFSFVLMTVQSATAAPEDGGTRLTLECTGLEVRGADGGLVPLADRTIDLLAPAE